MILLNTEFDAVTQ